MRYITFFTPARRNAPGVMPDPEHMEAMGRLIAEWSARGILVATGAMLDAAQGMRVTAQDCACTTRDGADQALAAGIEGFAILQGETREAILEATEAFLGVAGDGAVDLFPLFEPPQQA